jgi:hypothetical protein
MATPEKPTKEQWNEVKLKLSMSFGVAYFLIDGYCIQACIERDKMRLVVAVYVNGYIKIKDMWCGQERDVDNMTKIARRFYCLKSKASRAAKDIKTLEKLLGKRECKKKGFYDKWLTTSPWFGTAGAFIAHLKKHNQAIQVVDYATYQAALNERQAAIAPEVDLLSIDPAKLQAV